MLIPQGPFISCQSLFANFRTVSGEVSEENEREKKKNRKKEKEKKKWTNQREIHLPISLGTNDIAINYRIFAIKIFPTGVASGAIKEDLQPGSSLIAILAVFIAEKFLQTGDETNLPVLRTDVYPLCPNESFGRIEIFSPRR